MRIVFCGTPEFAVPSLRTLLSEPDFTVAAVVTQPDRPRGRGQVVTSSPVKAAALAAGVQVYQPERIKTGDSRELLARLAPDAVVIIAYGQIIPQRLIEIPRLGWINLHASLLPRYRGAAPINWAIVNGETVTGLTTMLIDAGMDTGPVLMQQQLEIGPDETAPELSLRMAEAGGPLVVESLRRLDRGEISPFPQDSSLASYAPRIEKDHGRIDWERPAAQIYNRIRGLAPWPGAFTHFRGQICQLWGRPALEALAASGEPPGTIVSGGGMVYAVCGGGTCLTLETVRLEGRKRVGAREFVNGARLAAGERFAS